MGMALCVLGLGIQIETVHATEAYLIRFSNDTYIYNFQYMSILYTYVNRRHFCPKCFFAERSPHEMSWLVDAGRQALGCLPAPAQVAMSESQVLMGRSAWGHCAGLRDAQIHLIV